MKEGSLETKIPEDGDITPICSAVRKEDLRVLRGHWDGSSYIKGMHYNSDIGLSQQNSVDPRLYTAKMHPSRNIQGVRKTSDKNQRPAIIVFLGENKSS